MDVDLVCYLSRFNSRSICILECDFRLNGAKDNALCSTGQKLVLFMFDMIFHSFFTSYFYVSFVVGLGLSRL